MINFSHWKNVWLIKARFMCAQSSKYLATKDEKSFWGFTVLSDELCYLSGTIQTFSRLNILKQVPGESGFKHCSDVDRPYLDQRSQTPQLLSPHLRWVLTSDWLLSESTRCEIELVKFTWNSRICWVNTQYLGTDCLDRVYSTLHWFVCKMCWIIEVDLWK